MAIKLKKVIRVDIPLQDKNTVKKTTEKTKTGMKKQKKNTLPPDTYREEIESFQIDNDEYSRINFSVKRMGELGLPYVDVRHYQTTDLYTGFTKKAITFPLERIDDMIEALEFVKRRCEEDGIE